MFVKLTGAACFMAAVCAMPFASGDQSAPAKASAQSVLTTEKAKAAPELRLAQNSAPAPTNPAPAPAPAATSSAEVVKSVAPQSGDAAKKDEAKMRARGDYLTHHVAMCVVCHSPKDSQGRPVPEQEFQGDAIPVHPDSGAEWARRAPALGPLASGASEEVIQLLKTGIWPRTGESPQSPMPPFRLTDEDARAVVAYLKSLKDSKH